MKHLFLTIAGAFFSFLLVDHLQAQDESVFVEETVWNFGMDSKGRIGLDKSVVFVWKSPFKEYFLFGSEAARKELEFSPDQTKRVSKLMVQFERKRRKEFRFENFGRRVDHQKYREFSKEIESRLFDVLSSTQKNRIKELYWWSVIRSQGIEKFVNEFRERKVLHQQKIFLKQLIKKQSSDWAALAENRCADAIEKFKKKFPKSTQSKIEVFLNRNPSFGKLDQLDFTSAIALKRLQSQNNKGKRASRLKELLKRSEYFRLAKEGSWEYCSFKVGITSGILRWIVRPGESGLGILELSPDQQAAFKQLQKDLGIRNEEVVRASSKMFDDKVDETEIQAYLSARNTELDRYALEVFQDQILLPPQRAAFMRELRKMESKKTGLFQFLLSTQHTDRDRKKLESNLKAFRKEIRKIENSGSEMEKQIIQSVFEKLDKRTSKEMLKQIGKPPKYLDFHWIYFRNISK